MRNVLLIVVALMTLSSNQQFPLSKHHRIALVRALTIDEEFNYRTVRLSGVSFMVSYKGEYTDIEFDEPRTTPVDISIVGLDRLLIEAMKAKLTALEKLSGIKR